MNRDYIKHSTESIRPLSSGSDTNAKVGEKRKRLTGTPHRKHHRHEDIPWTAVRCNRLLRTITSRIQILRRLSENNFADKAAARKSPARRKIIFNPEGHHTGRVSPEGVENVRAGLAALPALESPTKDSKDPDWLPDDGRKAAQKTYAGKGSGARRIKIKEPLEPVKLAGNADFRSPFIKRILRSDAANSPTNAITDTPRRATGHKIVLDPKTHAERALRTLLDSFDKVLSTTAIARPSYRRGAGSLRDMCLRKVPDYIDFEQKWAYDEEDYDYDATETIYVDLQKLGTGESWNGLREVVRAHAVKMIADAMDERSWPVESLDRILEVCERNQAVAEAQQILRSWLMKSEGRALNRMAKMLAWSKNLDCHGFVFRTLREMLHSGCLRIHEFSECPFIWQDMLKALARRSSRVEAAQFLETYVLACLRSDHDNTNPNEGMRLLDRLKRDEVLHNVMVLVTALCWTVEDTTLSSNDDVAGLSAHVHRMAIAVCQFDSDRSHEIQSDHHTHRSPRRGLSSREPFLTSSLALHALDQNTTPQQLQLDPGSLLPQSNDEATRANRSFFICSTAKCIAHLSQPSADGFIKDISTSLLLLSTRTSLESGHILKRFAADVAKEWADYRGDNESYAFAEDIERAASDNAQATIQAHTPDSSQRPKRFRWEEAIGEWIASTPLASAKKQATSLRSEVIFDGCSDGDSHQAIDHATETMPVPVSLQEVLPDATSEMVDERGTLKTGGSRSCSPQPVQWEKVPAASTFEQCSEEAAKSIFPEHDQWAENGPHAVANSVKIESLATLEHCEDSPLQAKAFRRTADHPVPEEIEERDELAATPFEKADRFEATSNLFKDANTLAPETPARVPSNSFTQSTLTIRTKDVAPGSNVHKNATATERDELAMTPAQQLLHLPVEPTSLRHNTEPPSAIPEFHGRDEMAATPARPIVQSTRVLRSARQRSAPALEQHTLLEPRDELAVTPAPRGRASAYKTKVPKRNIALPEVLESPARDELSATPQVLRPLRSRPQVARTKSRGRVQKGEPGQAPAPQIQKALPLGTRSANARSVAKARKVYGSEDELGL